jgi:hypothetical protein
MWLPIPRGHALEGMDGLFAAPEQAETEQSGEHHDAKRTVTPGPVKVIAQACEVLYHSDALELLCRWAIDHAPV